MIGTFSTGRPPRRAFLLALLLAGLSALSPGGGAPSVRAQDGDSAAQESQRASLPTELRALVDASGIGAELGVSVTHLRNGRPVFQYRADAPRNPASNMKLVTAAAALIELGPHFTMRTALYGRTDGDAVVDGLILRGYADPDLNVSDLITLARELADHGIRRVEGGVIVDGSYFDDERLPPSFDQQPNETAPFRAAISAVAVDRNAYSLRVIPGAEEGGTTQVRLAGAGYFELDNQIATGAEGSASRVIAVQRDRGAQMLLRLRGSLPIGIRGVTYRRRIENPLPWTGYLMTEALEAAGIRVRGGVRVGRGAEGAGPLAMHQSDPVAHLLRFLGKDSDNFVAEMIFKTIAAERRRPGRSADAAPIVRRAIEGLGVSTSRMDIVNGSGLFDGNHVTPTQLTTLLTAMYQRPAYRAEYLSQLAVGGVDGTLRRRLRDLPAPRIVRAKTGTLNNAIALSGYVLGPEPNQGFAFSFLANGVQGRQGVARQLADNIVRALARHLYPNAATGATDSAAGGASDEGEDEPSD